MPRQLESNSYQELKSKIARILDKSLYPNENHTNLALLAHTMKATPNTNIAEILNNLTKLPKEDTEKTIQAFMTQWGYGISLAITPCSMYKTF